MGDASCMDDFEEVLKLPENEANRLFLIDAHIKIAYCWHYIEGEFLASLDALASAFDLDENNASLYFHKALLLEAMELEEDVLENFKAAARLDPSFVHPRIEIAEALGKNAKEDASARKKALKGFEKLEKAILLDPSFPVPYYRKAKHLMNHFRNLCDAEEIFLKLISIDKKYWPAYLDFGFLQMKKGDMDAAMKYFERVLFTPSEQELENGVKFLEMAKALSKYEKVIMTCDEEAGYCCEEEEGYCCCLHQDEN